MTMRISFEGTEQELITFARCIALGRKELEKVDPLELEIRKVLGDKQPSGAWPGKIPAIKRHRELTGSDLKVAKDYVETLIARLETLTKDF